MLWSVSDGVYSSGFKGGRRKSVVESKTSLAFDSQLKSSLHNDWMLESGIVCFYCQIESQ